MKFDFDLSEAVLDGFNELLKLTNQSSEKMYQHVVEEAYHIVAQDLLAHPADKAIQFIHKFLQELQDPSTLGRLIELKEQIASDALSTEEKWLMAYFQLHRDSYSVARMWARLYHRMFTDDKVPSYLKRMMPHYCKYSAEKLAGFVIWVSEKEATFESLLTAYFVTVLAHIHSFNSRYMDDFLQILSLHGCRAFEEPIQQARKRLINEQRYGFHADAANTFLENMRITFEEDSSSDERTLLPFFENIQAIFGPHGIRQTLLFISGAQNISARAIFKVWLERYIVSIENAMHDLVEFAFEHNNAWSNLEQMFKNDAYFYFKQDLFAFLLMMSAQPEQLARLSNSELIEAMTWLMHDRRFRRHIIEQTIAVSNIIQRQERLAPELKDIIKEIRDRFPSSLIANEEDMKPTVAFNKSYEAFFSDLPSIRNMCLTAKTEEQKKNLFIQLSNPRNRPLIERLFLYGVAGKESALDYVLAYFKPVLTIHERLEFLEQNNVQGHSMFLHAAKKSTTLQIFLEWVKEAKWDHLKDSIIFSCAAAFPTTLQKMLMLFPPEKTLEDCFALINEINPRTGESLLMMAAKNALTLKVLLDWFKQKNSATPLANLENRFDLPETLLDYLNDPTLSSSAVYEKVLEVSTIVLYIYAARYQTPQAPSIPGADLFSLLLSECEVIFAEIEDLLIESPPIIARLHEQLLRLRPEESCFENAHMLSIEEHSAEQLEGDCCSIDDAPSYCNSSQIRDWMPERINFLAEAKVEESPINATKENRPMTMSVSQLSFFPPGDLNSNLSFTHGSSMTPSRAGLSTTSGLDSTTSRCDGTMRLQSIEERNPEATPVVEYWVDSPCP